METNIFDSAIADSLFLEARIFISKEKPDNKAYSWIKKNKPKIFIRAINFEKAWALAVDACDLKAVHAALDGMKGAWLHGYREYKAAL